MSGLFGILNINDTDRTFVQTIGQRVVYDAIAEVLAQYNADLQAALRLFVQGTTTDFKYRYKLPGGGRLQERGGLAQSGAVKATGEWDVAFPIREYGAQVAGSRVQMAYMTIQDLDRHLDTVLAQDLNTVRFEILKRLFNNTQTTFIDDYHGTLLIEPLANGDAVLYPPVLGSETEATESHYIGKAYATAAISATNNPLVTIRDELEEHFGEPQGGSNIVVFCNPDAVDKVTAITGFTQTPIRFVSPGADQALADVGLPSNMPGRVVGYGFGVWLVSWRQIPSEYMVGIHMERPAPMLMRVDLPETGLPTGLALVATNEDYPIETAHWEHRFGLGVANRLNGVVLELGSDTTYDIPAAYA